MAYWVTAPPTRGSTFTPGTGAYKDVDPSWNSSDSISDTNGRYIVEYLGERPATGGEPTMKVLYCRIVAQSSLGGTGTNTLLEGTLGVWPRGHAIKSIAGKNAKVNFMIHSLRSQTFISPRHRGNRHDTVDEKGLVFLGSLSMIAARLRARRDHRTSPPSRSPNVAKPALNTTNLSVSGGYLFDVRFTVRDPATGEAGYDVSNYNQYNIFSGNLLANVVNTNGCDYCHKMAGPRHHSGKPELGYRPLYLHFRGEQRCQIPVGGPEQHLEELDRFGLRAAIVEQDPQLGARFAY